MSVGVLNGRAVVSVLVVGQDLEHGRELPSTYILRVQRHDERVNGLRNLGGIVSSEWQLAEDIPVPVPFDLGTSAIVPNRASFNPLFERLDLAVYAKQSALPQRATDLASLEQAFRKSE
jgi:hypothetical protein